MPKSDLRLRGIVQWKRLRQVLLCEHLLVESVGEVGAVLVEHDPAGDRDESLAHRSHRGIRITVSFAVVTLVDKVTVPDHQQTAMLARTLRVVERLIQPPRVNPGNLAGGSGVFRLAQPPCASDGGK